MSLLLWIILVPILSFLLSFSYYRASVVFDYSRGVNQDYSKTPLLWRFCQIWNHFIPMVFGGVILYYFVNVRWERIVIESSISFNDFLLMIFFLMSATGLIPYLLTNITEGVNAILKRVLKL